MKKILSLLVLWALVLSFSSLSALAHPGRLDNRQGHKDEKDESGLGRYHYHCGGSEAHLHTDGECPILSMGAFDSSSPLPQSKTPRKANSKPPAPVKPPAFQGRTGLTDTKDVTRIEKMLQRFYINQSYAMEISGGTSATTTDVVTVLDVNFLEDGSLVFYTYDLDNNTLEKTTASGVKYSKKTGTLYFTIAKNTGFIIVSSGELQRQ